jgi:hypothetical protein
MTDFDAGPTNGTITCNNTVCGNYRESYERQQKFDTPPWGNQFPGIGVRAVGTIRLSLKRINSFQISQNKFDFNRKIL